MKAYNVSDACRETCKLTASSTSASCSFWDSVFSVALGSIFRTSSSLPAISSLSSSVQKKAEVKFFRTKHECTRMHMHARTHIHALFLSSVAPSLPQTLDKTATTLHAIYTRHGTAAITEEIDRILRCRHVLMGLHMMHILIDACMRPKQSMKRGSAFQSGKDPHIFLAQQERMQAHNGNGYRPRPTEGEVKSR